LASLSATEGDLIAFTLVGSGAEAWRLRQAGVHATGFYRSEDLGRLIDAADAHVVFFPSIWPETWSFVLTSALRHGLPVIAFDIGAPADRLRELGRGHLLPLELAFNPPELLGVFRRLREQYVNRPR
jgi:glycosyltransferase involved in cell wall biosynthesis